MEGDLIIVSIDPAFNIAQAALDELDEQNRLEVLTSQRSWLHAIQSNVLGDNNIFKFGQAFGRTASAVFRMVMLRAVQIEDEWWPAIGKRTTERNKEALRFAVSPPDAEPFKLLGEENQENNNRETAKAYFGKYDHAFPHNVIETKVSQDEGRRVYFRNKMLIFRNNFSEVIEIITNAHATMHPQGQGWRCGEFDSYVKVTCTRKEIVEGEVTEDGEYFKKLKDLAPTAGQKNAQAKTRVRDDVLKQLDEDRKNEDKKFKKSEDTKGKKNDDTKGKKNDDTKVKKNEDKKFKKNDDTKGKTNDDTKVKKNEDKKFKKKEDTKGKKNEDKKFKKNEDTKVKKNEDTKGKKNEDTKVKKNEDKKFKKKEDTKDNNSECDDGGSTLLANVEPPKRSHCSTCDHTRQGHGKGAADDKCPMCPNNLCSAHGRRIWPCTCIWHISQQNSIETVTPHSIVKLNTDANHVKEYLLSFCQSNIDSQALGSNACTIIAVLIAIDFLSDTAWFSQHVHNLLATLDSTFEFLDYCYQLFTKGNEMYDNLDESQVNYSAPHIIEHRKLPGLAKVAERGDEYQFNNFGDFVLELNELSLAKVKLAFVLIFSPDKSMTLLNELGESMLIDSHSHLKAGAIIATASNNQLHYMVNYIQKMILRDWGLTVTVQQPFDVTIVKLKRLASM